MDSNASGRIFQNEWHTHLTNNGGIPSYRNFNRVTQFIDLTDDGYGAPSIELASDVVDLSNMPNVLVTDPDTQNAQNRTDPNIIDLTEDAVDKTIAEISNESTSQNAFPPMPVIVDLTEEYAECPMESNRVAEHTTTREIEDPVPLNRLSEEEQNLNERIELDGPNSLLTLPVVVDSTESLLCEATTSNAPNRRATTMEIDTKDLNEELESLQKKISDLENSVVDLNDDNNSIFLHIDVYKTRACQIYERIKRKSGKSVKRRKIAIKFNGTQFPEFNAKLEKYANKKRRLPMFENALKLLKCCNQNANSSLTEQECYTLAEKSLSIIGKKLQQLRYVYLSETFDYYTNNHNDPAEHDPELRAKLDRKESRKSNAIRNSVTN